MTWPLAEAKNRFSEVVERALKEGPQRVTRRGKESVVVIAEAEFSRLKGKRRSFGEFLLSAPSFEGVDTSRDKTDSRKVRL